MSLTTLASYDGFGTAVAIVQDVNGDGYDDILIGAWGYYDDTRRPGAVFLYRGAAGNPTTEPGWWVFGDEDGARFGWDVASAGDVNGDGFGDVIVGAPLHDGIQPDVGRSFVYLGSLDGLATTPTWSVAGAAAQDFAGNSVSGGFDLNGDGFDDVAIDVPGARRVEVYAGSPNGLPTTATWIVDGNAYVSPGRGIGGAGDTNNDGFDDLIQGSAFEFRVHFGSATGLYPGGFVAQMLPTSFGESPSVTAGAGDVDGDGWDDVIAGLPMDNEAEVYSGQLLGLFATGWSFSGATALGSAATGVGDVNGDGFADVAAAEILTTVRGAVRVYLGSSSGPQTTPVATLDEGEPYLGLGYDIAGGGDVNGDGYDDVLVGNDAGQIGPFPGLESVLLFPGAADGVATASTWRVYGRPPPAEGARAIDLRVSRGTNPDLVGLSWAADPDACSPWAIDFQVYRGVLGSYGSHLPLNCGPFLTSPPYNLTVMAGPENAYFLIVPYNGPSEGSYGTRSDGSERPQGPAWCRPQRILNCD